jgi:hypothetical protein
MISGQLHKVKACKIKLGFFFSPSQKEQCMPDAFTKQKEKKKREKVH